MSKAKVSTLAISLFFIVVCTCKPRLVSGDNYCDSEQRLSYHYKLWALRLSPWGYVEGSETTLQWHYPVILPQQLRAILRNRPTANSSLTKLYICSLLLLNACDTETNPGPGADHSTVYPCGACDMPVTWAQQAVACETCSVGTTSTVKVSSHRHMTPYTHQQMCGTATHVVSPTIRQHSLT